MNPRIDRNSTHGRVDAKSATIFGVTWGNPLENGRWGGAACTPNGSGPAAAAAADAADAGAAAAAVNWCLQNGQRTVRPTTSSGICRDCWQFGQLVFIGSAMTGSPYPDGRQEPTTVTGVNAPQPCRVQPTCIRQDGPPSRCQRLRHAPAHRTPRPAIVRYINGESPRTLHISSRHIFPACHPKICSQHVLSWLKEIAGRRRMATIVTGLPDCPTDRQPLRPGSAGRILAETV